MDAADVIENVFLSLVGLTVFAGSLSFVLYRASWRWRQLEAVYAATPDERPQQQRWTNMVLAGGDLAWNTYSGVTLIGVNRRGITLNLLPPFSLFHRPLFFAYPEVRFVPARWLFQEAVNIELARASAIRIVINTPTLRWIEERRAALARPDGSGPETAHVEGPSRPRPRS